MTRDEMLALYRPIRASVRRILSAAVPACNHADLARAAKQLDLWAEGKIVLPEGDKPAEMLSDIALFEPNQRGRRAFDRFLSNAARRLDAGDCELAERMGRLSSLCFILPLGTQRRGFGSRICSMATEASGSWTRPWRGPRQSG